MFDRNVIVNIMKSWLGISGQTKKHQEILDIYNGHTPLARKYKIKSTDAWCAATVSAAAIKAGYTDIIPTEVSCGKMIDLLKKLDSWEERDDYVPKPGDLIFFYWGDSGNGEYDGVHASHVGIVEKCDGKYIYTIEGNYNNAVRSRKIAVNGRYIRGFGVPKYDADSTPETPQSDEKIYIVQKGDNLTKIAKRFNTTVKNLVLLNKIDNPNLIRVGQEIKIG